MNCGDVLSFALLLSFVVTLQAQTGAPSPLRKQTTTRLVVLTTDCGAEMDDQWTLAHLALASEVELRGVVTTHAPSLAAPAAETAAGAVRDVLRHLPRVRKIPVIAGSSIPLADHASPLLNPGVEFLLRESRRHTSRARLAVVVIGAATDVASAMLIDPKFAGRVEIIAMGFENWTEGGDSWNVKNDPRAWQVLLASHAPVVIGDATVTKSYLAMTRKRAEKLFKNEGTTGRYLVNLLAKWLDRDPAFNLKVTGQPDTWIIWDQVTVAFLLGLTEYDLRPRPTLRDDLCFTHTQPAHVKRTVTWIKSIDSDSLWKHFLASLSRARMKTHITEGASK